MIFMVILILLNLILARLMKKKIAIITDIGFQKKEFDKFFIKRLSEAFEVYIFDFTKITNPKLNEIVKKKQLKLNNFHEVENFEDFKKNFLSNEFLTTIHHISNYELILKLNDFFRINSFSLTVIQNHYVIQLQKNIFQNFLNIFFTFLDIKRLMGKLRYLKFKKKNIFFANNIFVCGLKGLNDSMIGPESNIIKCHSREYDLHLNSYFQKENSLINEKYSVFLDQYLPFHTDGTIFKRFNPKVTKEKYFPALNNFFSNFEKYSNTKVVIASHPKSNYEDAKEDYWHGRSFYYDKTYELIKNASYVLCHQSSALSYAVILEKPIIFLTSNEYIKSYDSFTVHGYSRYFQQPLFNIDTFNKQALDNNLKKINKDIYKKYFNDYIKYPDSQDIQVSEIFINYFKNIIRQNS